MRTKYPMLCTVNQNLYLILLVSQIRLPDLEAIHLLGNIHFHKIMRLLFSDSFDGIT